MAKPAPPTLTDYAVTAISPALIMLMVGSLVWFLIEVLYAGNYSDRLLWTMTFFVIGTVLIARIMILHGANRALVYAAGLAAATFLALQAFVDYPNITMRSFGIFINAGLMALIWWSANKLTWDCTHIDEDRRNAGRGVLDAATDLAPDEEAPPPKRPDPPGMMGWMARWQRHRDAQLKKPHTPGVWVLYFSVAALPLFGLGQSLIPAGDEARRRATFQEMAIYVGSGLGLLATTTLLGLRKYLRDRGASIPVKMTAGWLGLGAAIIVAFLVIGAFLPRPFSESPLFKLPKFADSKERDASKNAQVKDRSTGKGEGNSGNETKSDPNSEATRDGQKGPPNRDDKNGDGSQKKGDSDQKSNGESEEKSKSETKGEQKAGSKSEEKKSEQKQSSREQRDEKSDSKSGESQSKTASSLKLGNIMEAVSTFIKWLAWLIIAIMVIAAIAIFFLRYLAPFTSWAKNILDWLSGLLKRRKGATGSTAEEIAEPPPVKRPPPFDSFANPFQGGQRMPVAEMVSYSFAAFESWAWDRGYPRNENETPFEFAKRIEKQTGFDGQPLVKLYGQVLYSQMELQNASAKTVKEFWSGICERGV